MKSVKAMSHVPERAKLLKKDSQFKKIFIQSDLTLNQQKASKN